MRKLLAFILATYLLTFWMPFIALASHGADQLEGESDCDYDGSNCDTADTSTTSTDPADEETSALEGVSSICPFGEVFVYSPGDDRAAKDKEYAVINAEQSAAMGNSYGPFRLGHGFFGPDGQAKGSGSTATRI